MLPTIIVFYFAIPTTSFGQNPSQLMLSQMNDIQYDCSLPSCSLPTILTASSLINCQIFCLKSSDCRTLTFDQLSNQCLVFSNHPSHDGSLTTQIGSITMIAIDQRARQQRPQHHRRLQQQLPALLVTTTALYYVPTSLWRFDNTTLDSLSNLNGVGVNSPAFKVPGINGRAALSLTRSQNQYVTISTYQNFTYTSFTIEMWIYINSLSGGNTFGLFSQRENATTNHLLISFIWNNHLALSFYSNDVIGSTTLSLYAWYHATLVYDYPSRTQAVYLNGYQDGIHTSADPYLGTVGAITIGMFNDSTNAVQAFDGYIDEVSLTMRSKNATEILNDATLTTYHSFDSIPFVDSGPLALGVIASGVNLVTGRVNQSLNFTTNSSYYQVSGFVLLGVSNQPFSFALWTKRTTTAGGATLVHMSTLMNGTGWCVDWLGFSSSGQIVATGWNSMGYQVVGPVFSTNVWTHVVSTYSPTNGLRLYVNGTLMGTADTRTYNASEQVNILTLGNPLKGLNGTSCNSMAIVTTPYIGYLDEFYVYSRELSGADVLALANP
ncbi:unnamed protein product [Adineta ricciae]|uniref:Apple domain-containing protein n=1 Tax=Adineta ricciae TaxID=249248 RepID=A0A815AYI4_ADIRI|nr:unnamed protein product [Adineta ricciae]